MAEEIKATADLARKVEINIEQPDRIEIRDLRVSTVVGVYPEERHQPRDVIVNLVLVPESRAACRSDDLSDAVDYDAVAAAIRDLGENSRCELIEALSENIASLILDNFSVERVELTLDKPNALPHARSVAYTICRSRNSETNSTRPGIS